MTSQNSSGGKESLGRITNRGHDYLHTLLIQGANSAVMGAHKRDAPTLARVPGSYRVPQPCWLQQGRLSMCSLFFVTGSLTHARPITEGTPNGQQPIRLSRHAIHGLKPTTSWATREASVARRQRKA